MFAWHNVVFWYFLIYLVFCLFSMLVVQNAHSTGKKLRTNPYKQCMYV